MDFEVKDFYLSLYANMIVGTLKMSKSLIKNFGGIDKHGAKASPPIFMQKIPE